MVKNEENFILSETGNWNVAADFSKIKIMKLLANCDVYENIAEFGYDTLQEELMNVGIPNDNLRIMGFKRLVKELIKIIKNSKFAMKKDSTNKDMEGFEKRLIKIRKIIPALSKRKTSQRTKVSVIEILPKNFDIILQEVLEIKSEINIPLNKNHLIFTDKEEFDPKAYKKKIFEGAVSRG